MANRKSVKVTYHCDMYYFNNVCPHRGESDPADIRYRDGWTERPRSICKNVGLDWNDRLCRHCMENKRFFRHEPRVLTGRVVHITRYHAKDAKAVTIRAYHKVSHLIEYLKLHPSLYGVDNEAGVIIEVDKK